MAKRDNARVARLLAEAPLTTDAKVCESHGITLRTLQNYLAALKTAWNHSPGELYLANGVSSRSTAPRSPSSCAVHSITEREAFSCLRWGQC